MLEVTIEGLDDLERDWADALRTISDGTRTGVANGCTEGAAEALATRHWRDRTGQTAAKTRGYLLLSTPGGAIGVIECTVPWASFLEEGTPDHDIWPKEGRGFVGPLRGGQSRRKVTDVGTHRIALRWYDSGGQPRFATMVHHPGTSADGFMGRAALKAERVVIRDVEASVDRAAAIMAR